ncbi:MAG: FAD-binding domain-containing protein, partial [Planctomycetota bacterium]
WGERHFMRNLVDGDLASNNGGWQWSASTGADAAPYFRIFNPFRQSRKFDPDGAFIRSHVPELKGVEGDAIHDPSALPDPQRPKLGYPQPVVDHTEAAAGAVARFRALRS